MITVDNCTFEREPLIAPFGFKGGYVSEAWQSCVRLAEADGSTHVGLGTQSVLWSDAAVFKRYSQSESNAMMFLTTSWAARRAAQRAAETGADHPIDLMNSLVPETYEQARRLTGVEDLRLTFALNALVPVDFALWVAYARRHGLTSFDDFIPDGAADGLSVRHDRLGNIPLITYGVTPEQIQDLVDEGFFFLKIKIGADPAGDGDQEAMLEWDKNRLEEIHRIAGSRSTPHTESGNLLYYLDANGRYESKDRLKRLIDHADHLGILDRVALVEEPFPEEDHIEVGDFPVPIVADESAHSVEDVVKRIDLGYSAVALKPIAKTLSITFGMIEAAHKHGVMCFCADLTVNPIMVDWNKNVAARLAALPGVKTGLVESNGAQNYRNWERMIAHHPMPDGEWVRPKHGTFHLDDTFYRTSGGILEQSEHYLDLP